MSYIFDWRNGINKDELKKCVNIIKNGGIIIYPTDTVYGIGCNVWNEEAIKKIFEIKNRNYNKPMNVLCSDMKDIESLVLEVNEKEKEIVNSYMPGACTLVINKKRKEVSDILRAGLNTVAVRIPNNHIAIELIRECGFPLVSTSANVSGEDSATEIEKIVAEFKDKVDVIIDGGKSKIGVPSTIIQVDNKEIKVLRQGSLEIEA